MNTITVNEYQNVIGIRYVLSTELEAMNELRFACKLFSVTSSNETSTITEFRVPKRLCPQGLIGLWSACIRWNKVRSRNKTTVLLERLIVLR